MENILTLVAFLAVWYVLQVWLLPRLGEPCRNRPVGAKSASSVLATAADSVTGHRL
jgi:hypothetical protein